MLSITACTVRTLLRRPSITAIRGFRSVPGAQGSALGTDVEMIAANHRHAHSNNRIQIPKPCAFSTTAMQDEYGTMDASGETMGIDDFPLESGAVLPRAEMCYQTYGTLNAAKDNCIVVCHALTGNASLHAWWGDLLGSGRAFDTDQYFVVCANILGSCYGSTNPTSVNPDTDQVYGVDFPDVSVRDSVRLQLLLLRHELGVKSIRCVIGGSFGGMQALEFAVQAGGNAGADNDSEFAGFLQSAIPIACGRQHNCWQIAISQVQRNCIYADPEWQRGNHFGATQGLSLARQLGMISYRTPTGYDRKFGREVVTASSSSEEEKKDDGTTPPALFGSSAHWQVQSYLDYQGTKFLDRFDPVTYVKLTEQMDSHDVARGRGSDTASVLKERVDIPTLVMGIDSDILYPLEEQKALAAELQQNGAGSFHVIRSEEGHDGFLLEQEQVAQHITQFLNDL